MFALIVAVSCVLVFCRFLISLPMFRSLSLPTSRNSLILTSRSAIGCLNFFFSSRRRHTRWTGDWSSDVCSSDLAPRQAEERDHPGAGQGSDSRGRGEEHHRFRRLRGPGRHRRPPPYHRYVLGPREPRSEERRVGKECRSRGWPYHEKKKK